MKKAFMTLSVVAMLTAPLGACATDGTWNMGTKQTVGTATGAVLGGIAGSKVGSGNGQLWATGVGTLLGAFLGSEVGKSLDRADMMYASRAVEEAYSAPMHETIAWKNPESGNHGTVTPVREGNTSSGDYCREYQQTIVVDGQAETAYGTACKQADGSWVLVN